MDKDLARLRFLRVWGVEFQNGMGTSHLLQVLCDHAIFSSYKKAFNLTQILQISPFGDVFHLWVLQPSRSSLVPV